MPRATAELLAGRYELIEPLGDDHLGRSFRALDHELRCQVRLKRFHPHLAEDPLLRRRFRHELMLLRCLAHPVLLGGYELVEDGAELFFTTELPTGQPLPGLLAAEPLEPARARALLRPLLEALGSVHERGLLHRDLQPCHLYVGKDGLVKLGGFALARCNDLATVTAHSRLVAEPRYRAPEVLRGEAAQAASDLYAAGLILAEMLGGRCVYPHEALLQQIQLKSERVEDWPARLGLVPGSEGALLAAALLPGLLDPDPLRRYRSAAEVLEALSALEAPPAALPAARHEPLPAGRHEQPCPACGEPMVRATHAGAPLPLCFACGLSARCLHEWGRGPYALALSMDGTYRRNKRGRLRKVDALRPDPTRQLEALRLVEQMWGPLPPEAAHHLNADYLLVARQIDAGTARRLTALFASRELRLWRVRTGRLGDRLLGLALALRKRMSRATLFLASFVAMCGFITYHLVLNRYFDGADPFVLVLVLGLGLGLSFMASMAAPTGAPGTRLREQQEPEPPDEIAPELVQEYGRIGDPGLRQAVRGLLAETRSFHGRQEAPGPGGEPGLPLQLLEPIELEALRLLAAVPAALPLRKAELLAEAQKAEARRGTAELEARPDLDRTCADLHEALDRLEEADALRVRLEARVQRWTLALRTLRLQSAQMAQQQLQARAQRVLDELLLAAGEPAAPARRLEA